MAPPEYNRIAVCLNRIRIPVSYLFFSPTIHTAIIYCTFEDRDRRKAQEYSRPSSHTAVQVPDYKGEGLKVYETFADPGVPEQFGQAMLFIDNADIPVTIINTTQDRDHPDIIINR